MSDYPQMSQGGYVPSSGVVLTRERLGTHDCGRALFSIDGGPGEHIIDKWDGFCITSGLPTGCELMDDVEHTNGHL